MVAAPLSTVDINVNLLASTAHPAARPEKPLFVTVKSDLSLALGEAAVSRDNLAGALDAATGADKEQRIFVRADRTVAYGEIMELMNPLRAGGYLKLELVALEAGPEGGSATPGEPARSASEIKPVAPEPMETSPVGLKP
jgi:biopolymer transport protein ExbD